MDDLQSFPEDMEDSFDEFQDKVDRFTEEFFQLLLDEVKENQALNLNIIPNEDDFKDKFPYNLDSKSEENEKTEEVKPPTILWQPKIEEEKKESIEEQMAAKYERELK